MRAKFDERGNEIPDPTPVAIPSGFRRPPTLQEQIRALVRHERYIAGVNNGEIESIEEADDFDVDDEEFPASRWEFEADEQDLRALVRHETNRVKREEKLREAAEQRKPKKKVSAKAKEESPAPVADDEES